METTRELKKDQGQYRHIELGKWLVQPQILTLVKSDRYFPVRLSLWAGMSLAIGRISTTA